jgi:hypothetical protein
MEAGGCSLEKLNISKVFCDSIALSQVNRLLFRLWAEEQCLDVIVMSVSPPACFLKSYSI